MNPAVSREDCATNALELGKCLVKSHHREIGTFGKGGQVALCRAKIADGLRHKLDSLAHDDEAIRRLGVAVCTDICRRLLDAGVPGIHFYCLNRSASCTEIFRNLGLAG